MTRSHHHILATGLTLAGLLFGALGARAAETGGTETIPQGRQEIHFIQYGGVRDWRAFDDDAIYIQGRNGKWYEATFFGPCLGLGFATRVGFVADVGGTLDRFGSIIVRAPGSGLTECHFKTFKEVPRPPTKEERKAAREAAKR